MLILKDYSEKPTTSTSVVDFKAEFGIFPFSMPIGSSQSEKHHARIKSYQIIQNYNNKEKAGIQQQ